MAEIKQIQTQIFRVGLHQNPDALNKLMVFCTNPSIGNLGYAERIFNFIEDPSLFIYNVMIKAFAKHGSFRRAVSLFDGLRVQGLWPDNYTYPFVFKAIGCLKEGFVGEKVHGFVVKSGVDFDCYVCNSLMDMYAELGWVETVKKVFDEMPERDSVSWNVLISGYVRCNRFEDAIDVFRRMQRESNAKPDEATVVSTLSACTALKNLELGKEIHHYVARQIFDAMPTKNVICWTSMVSGYVSCGRLDEARDLFERSPVKDLVLWTAMINGYVQFNRVDEAVALFREMQIERIKPDKFTVVALLTGCSQLGALEQGKWIHRCIEENRITIDVVVGTALVDIWEDVTKVRRKMKALGVKKAPGCSSIEVDGNVHEFLVGDASNPDMKQVYSILDSITKPLSGLEDGEMEEYNTSGEIL
ncbi:pentatricopeptide repeat (PPR-like) superfamily protein [Actinidia rufa]|uniref:Pentatricopeptide repeat (PPR-like) superfamily protein n=1 Tax=Actinidia rufa TaxID=165716 RepID=A0A7J0FCW5_9ERIC|nr:pentatricopeptide repeat (PPR-like) superfamily protein [Actinidia rufa]